MRKQIGVTLERQPAINYIAGLLVDGLDDVPADHDVIAGEGDVYFLLFHQGGGRARAYICTGLSDSTGSRAGQGTERFLEAVPLSSLPVERQRGGGHAGRAVRHLPRRRHVDRRAVRRRCRAGRRRRRPQRPDHRPGPVDRAARRPHRCAT